MELDYFCIKLLSSTPILVKFLFLFFLAVHSIEGESDFENDPLLKHLEVGFRSGVGYKPEDRFESQLRSYRSDNSYGVYTYSKFQPFHLSNNLEFYTKLTWSDNFKVGLSFGNTAYEKSSITEINTNLEFTKLDFKFKHEYLFMNLFYLWNFRKFYLETGIGLGINNTIWKTGGYSIIYEKYKNQNGYMTGNGLSYRAEASYNYLWNESVVLNIGLTYNYHTVPKFDGIMNQKSSSYYLNSDGTIATASPDQYRNSVLKDAYITRSLDMAISNTVLFFGVSYRFNLN